MKKFRLNNLYLKIVLTILLVTIFSVSVFSQEITPEKEITQTEKTGLPETTETEQNLEEKVEDSEPPQISVEPPDGTVNPGAIKIDCKDNIGCENLIVEYNGLKNEYKVKEGNTDIEVELENKNSSIRTLKISARDAAGNLAEKEIRYRIDKSAPKLSIRPKPGRYRSLDELKIECKDDLQCSKVEVTWEGKTQTLRGEKAGLTESIRFTPPLNNDVQINITAFDSSGNKSNLTARYVLGSTWQVWAGLGLDLTQGDLSAAVPIGFGMFMAAETPFERLPWAGKYFIKLKPWLQNVRTDIAYHYFPNDPAYLEFMGFWVGPSYIYNIKGVHDVFGALQGGFMYARAKRNPQSAVSFTSSFSVLAGYRWRGWVVWPFGQVRFMWLGDASVPYLGIAIETGVSYGF
ncbi:MAG: hypothetical protein KDK41_11520 [Leptospiraceae bacterium]|nr:hypothetical protein [Leptospiraceae bacterium]